MSLDDIQKNINELLEKNKRYNTEINKKIKEDIKKSMHESSLSIRKFVLAQADSVKNA